MVQFTDGTKWATNSGGIEDPGKYLSSESRSYFRQSCATLWMKASLTFGYGQPQISLVSKYGPWIIISRKLQFLQASKIMHYIVHESESNSVKYKMLKLLLITEIITLLLNQEILATLEN